MITVNDVSVEFRQGMTLKEALAEACVDLEKPMLITVDGRLVDKNSVGRFELHDAAKIQVMPILSGG